MLDQLAADGHAEGRPSSTVKVLGSGFRVQGLGFKVRGSEFRVQGVVTAISGPTTTEGQFPTG